MKIIKLFEEFVPVADYKKWKDFYNKDFYNKVGKYFEEFTDHDKNFNRIYFDLKIDPRNFSVTIPTELKDYMDYHGYKMIDYDKGLCADKNGKQVRIGKLLNRVGETKLLKVYNDSKTDKLKYVSDLQVVISRHPYDIIGMSTNRGWTTCQDLNDKRYHGEYLYGIKNILEGGSLIAYLIRKKDRNIKYPISRCLIRDVYGKLTVDRKIYGTNVKDFHDFLIKWVKDAPSFTEDNGDF